jgi:hypothetical protein
MPNKRLVQRYRGGEKLGLTLASPTLVHYDDLANLVCHGP